MRLPLVAETAGQAAETVIQTKTVVQTGFGIGLRLGRRLFVGKKPFHPVGHSGGDLFLDLRHLFRHHSQAWGDQVNSGIRPLVFARESEIRIFLSR